MARKKKPKRRMVYSVSFGFHDGAVIGVGPERKPSAKRIKEDGLHICPDGVFREYTYPPTYWHTWDEEKRHELATILAIRLNARRALREIVIPELKAIESRIDALIVQLDRIEKSIDRLAAR